MSAITQAQRVAGVAVDHANREKDDFYPTPPEGTEALLSVERFDGAIWEPACGDGAISKVLAAHGYDVVSTDLVDRGFGTPRVDFLMESAALAPNIITNPPFKLSTQFMRHAHHLADEKVAIFLRLACLAGSERSALFRCSGLARVWVFSRRITLWRNGEEKSHGGGMTDFAWFVWDKQHAGKPTLGWL